MRLTLGTNKLQVFGRKLGWTPLLLVMVHEVGICGWCNVTVGLLSYSLLNNNIILILLWALHSIHYPVAKRIQEKALLGAGERKTVPHVS